MENRNKNSRWLKIGQSRFETGDNYIILDKLESGLYQIEFDNKKWKIFFTKLTIDNSNLIDLKQEETEEVFNMVKTFCESKDLYRKWNFKYKRGCLLYGVPGTGKSSIISKSIQYVIDQGGVCFVIKTCEQLKHFNDIFYSGYREIEATRLTLAIYEDIDGIVTDTNCETLLINMLDGIGDGNNIFSIATTNYTEKLNDRLVKRPGRFDRKIEIKSPNYEVRIRFFDAMIPETHRNDIDISKWAKDTEGFTIAELSEFLKSYFLCGESFEDSLSIIKNLEKNKTSKDYNKDTKEKIGFTNK